MSKYRVKTRYLEFKSWNIITYNLEGGSGEDKLLKHSYSCACAYTLLINSSIELMDHRFSPLLLLAGEAIPTGHSLNCGSQTARVAGIACWWLNPSPAAISASASVSSWLVCLRENGDDEDACFACVRVVCHLHRFALLSFVWSAFLDGSRRPSMAIPQIESVCVIMPSCWIRWCEVWCRVPDRPVICPELQEIKARASIQFSGGWIPFSSCNSRAWG